MEENRDKIITIDKIVSGKIDKIAQIKSIKR